MQLSMIRKKRMSCYSNRIALIIVLFISIYSFSQGDMKWSKNGNSYYKLEKQEIVQYTLPKKEATTLLSKKQLTPTGASEPLSIYYFSFSNDGQKALLFTNTQKVWRLETKGDYWIMDIQKGELKQLGKTLPAASLMFAKFSPDGKSVAYVSGNNIYTEDLATSYIKAMTNDGSVTLINGTFDWAYEEEFGCRDGFRWSPDSKSIAYWQLDASSIKKYYMINNTDAIYSQLVPLEYPKVGESPSSCKVGVVTIADATTTWINLPGEPEQHYIVRMEFIPESNELLIQQLNRKQNHSKLFVSAISDGSAKMIQEETDESWIELYQSGNTYEIDFVNDFTWLAPSKSILWVSEKDGWRHLYQLSLDGKSQTLITKGEYDIIDLLYTDAKMGLVYFTASPENATQKYLYSVKLNGRSEQPTLLSPTTQKGNHYYSISSNGQYAMHAFSNHFTPHVSELITVANHKPLNPKEGIDSKLKDIQETSTTEFFTITTKDNVEMDGWMVKPKNFDPKKKYPVVFYVYTEPAGATVSDAYGSSYNFLYKGDMMEDGYIYISLDNRGTPAPKGRAWRKSIYRKLGQVNIRDQAMAATEILKWEFIDAERTAVWGWSGGGSATLNLLFQYPEIYKTGIAIAAVGNQLTYDNIYQERFMGLPQENPEDFIKGSPITYAKNLEGNLLYIHGTGDDNIHYQNAEMLVNELIKYNKQFQFMPYPNRTHSISEGEGTFEHLSTLYTNYLKTHCPPGGR